MTDKKRDMIRAAAERASKIFRKDGSLLPIWECHTSKGEIFVIGTPFDGGASKEAASAMLRAMFELKDVVSFVFMTEAWVRAMDPAEYDADKLGREGLSNDPKREEALVYQAEDATGQLMARQMITRPGGKARLGPLDFQDEITRSEGRFVGMLPRRDATVQ